MDAPVRLPLLQVDAFSRDPFGGNPAAVVVLEGPRPAAWLQAVAAEMNLSETAFLLRRGDGRFDLRWFTPAVEVTLCGHATLASAYVLWSTGRAATGAPIVFETLSGALTARAERGRHASRSTFRSARWHRRRCPDGIAAALGIEPLAVHAARKGPGGTRLHRRVRRRGDGRRRTTGLRAAEGGRRRYHPHRQGVDARMGLRLALLRAGLRDRRGSGHGVGALRARRLLGRAPRPDVVHGTPGVEARRHAAGALDGDRVHLGGPRRHRAQRRARRLIDRRSFTRDHHGRLTRKTLIAQYQAPATTRWSRPSPAPTTPPSTAGPGRAPGRHVEIVHHLADSEMTSAIRLRRLMAEEQRGDHRLRPGRVRAEAALRPPDRRVARSVPLGQGLVRGDPRPHDRRRLDPSRHAQRDAAPTAITRWLEIYAEHAIKHAAQIRRARASAA